MARHASLGASRRLIVLFVLVLLIPAITVIWLGVRLFEQDRAMASRQLREGRENTADRLVASLELAISSTERRLHGGPSEIPIRADDDAVLLLLTLDGIDVYPEGRLLYVPALPPESETSSDSFETGEALEFRDEDYEGAAAAFRELATSASVSEPVRAGALLRLGRTLRKAGRVEEALGAYTDLEMLSDVRLLGVPADLVARRARCVLLKEAGRDTELAAEAHALQTDLVAGRWPIEQGTFVTYVEQVDEWAGIASQITPERRAVSAATAWIWQRWFEPGRGQASVAGRQALWFSGVGVTVVWRSQNDVLAALVAGPQFQQREWFSASQADAHADGLWVTLADADGQPVVGTLPDEMSQVERRPASQTNLPWTVFVGNSDAAAQLEEIAARRRLLLSGLLILVGLVVAGGYVVGRAVSRELAVARLQSDFVSAVSHEFRTPLTSLGQFVDLLQDDPNLPVEKRRTFYQAQARATERLRRLVESLLDFGRMEAGARPYRRERQSIAPLVRAIIDDFRQDGVAARFRIDVSISSESEGQTVDVDADALTRALWNLLDNAVKYSGSSRTVSVAVGMESGSVVIRVRDYGLGVPRHEQESIFTKFVRGGDTRMHGIEGTGIGLSIVRHIVEAHDGTVRVESTPGQGSTFTLILPAASPLQCEEAGQRAVHAVEER